MLSARSFRANLSQLCIHLCLSVAIPEHLQTQGLYECLNVTVDDHTLDLQRRERKTLHSLNCV